MRNATCVGSLCVERTPACLIRLFARRDRSCESDLNGNVNYCLNVTAINMSLVLLVKILYGDHLDIERPFLHEI